MMILDHAEHCGKENVDDAGSQHHGQRKLIGLARFDDSDDAPPEHFKTLILWKYRDLSLFLGEDLWYLNESKRTEKSLPDRLLRFLRTEQGKTEDVRDMEWLPQDLRPIRHSDTTILGIEKCPGDARSDMNPIHLAVSAIRRSKKNFSLLLVVPAGRPGCYRRVGIGSAYWIPKVQRFGGVNLEKACKYEDLTLV
jgi:hypothetical protein